MKSILVICAIILVLIPCNLDAERTESLKGSLSGRVTDKKTGEAAARSEYLFSRSENRDNNRNGRKLHDRQPSANPGNRPAELYQLQNLTGNDRPVLS